MIITKKVRCVTALALVAAAASQTSAQGRSDPDLGAHVDALASSEAGDDLLSGIVLIARGDHIFFQHAYGFADWELRVPNSRVTRFGIASITKPMTEALVDVLVAEGRLDLSAPVAKYISGFPVGPNGGQPTIRDLVMHRSGVPHRVTTDAEEVEPFRPADIVERVKKTRLLFEPGTQELYSSAGYTSLARVVEIVEGKPFDSVLAERVFRPAAMSSATGETGEQLMMNRARPYKLSAGATTVTVASAPYKDLTFLTGAGSVYATAEDLFHFVRALHDKEFGPVAAKLLGGARDTTWTGIYGRTNGYEGSVDYLPSQDLTLIFLSNLQSTANWQLREQFRNVLVGRAVAAIRNPPPVAPSFEDASAVVGSYDDPPDPIVISQVDGRLFRDGDEVYPIAGGWYYEPVSGATMRFARASDGNVDEMLTHYGCCRPDRHMKKLASGAPRE